jgi:protein-tyrosine phosphatase
MPELGLGAEHFCDDVFWERLQQGRALPYPGDAAALLELPPERIPLGLDARLFQMNVRGIRPVLAHPERYAPLFRNTDALEPMLPNLLPQLDLMSLTGKYGRRPRKAAERMLEEDIYFLACSDCHDPRDVPLVGEAIERLRELVGAAAAQRLLSEHPRAILEGRA